MLKWRLVRSSKPFGTLPSGCNGKARMSTDFQSWSRNPGSTQKCLPCNQELIRSSYAREGHNWGSSPSRISSFASCTGILNVYPAASLTHEEAARYGRDVSRTVDER